MNIYWMDMLVVPVVQFAAKSTQKTAMYFASEMDRKWRPSNKNRNVLGQTLFIHGSGNAYPYPCSWRAFAAFLSKKRSTHCTNKTLKIIGPFHLVTVSICQAQGRGSKRLQSVPDSLWASCAYQLLCLLPMVGGSAWHKHSSRTRSAFAHRCIIFWRVHTVLGRRYCPAVQPRPQPLTCLPAGRSKFSSSGDVLAVAVDVVPVVVLWLSRQIYVFSSQKNDLQSNYTHALNRTDLFFQFTTSYFTVILSNNLLK